MASISPHAPISYASRRRLARWLVSAPLREVERDLILETLANTRKSHCVSTSARAVCEDVAK